MLSANGDRKREQSGHDPRGRHQQEGLWHILLSRHRTVVTVLLLLVGAVVAALLYAAGWLLEDTRYWLAEEAVAVWGVALPAWLFLVALSWRARWGGWLTGFAVAIPVLALHLGIMWLIEGRLNDDDVGISAMFAGAALAGWLLGRLVHYVVRRARARAVGGGG